MTLESYLRAAPMAELHVHLEVAVAPATLLNIVRRVDDPATLIPKADYATGAAIDDILLGGVRHSFLPAEDKQQLAAAFRAELDALKAPHLLPGGTHD